MKKISITLIAAITMFSCSSQQKEKSGNNPLSGTNAETKFSPPATGFNWEIIPVLKDIGNYPFIIPPKGMEVARAKDGLSQAFDDEMMQVYDGKQLFEVEGKLGVMEVRGESDENFNHKFFDRSIFDYLSKIGAKKIFQGTLSNENDDVRESFRKNMWAGSYGSSGISDSDPFAVYAFRNNGKRYILCTQSNTAGATVFIMELQGFEQTMKRYTADQMKEEIATTGKAILYISFDTDQSTIKADGVETVHEIATLLKGDSGLKLSIEGHTDNTGAADHNKKLSIDRATSVLNAVVAEGVDKSRLKASGFGAEKPLVANTSEENKAKNRRVELVKM